jgi:phosphatidylethanolamine/phosphatidyl-N-methylethanolamine N-methyltransferase
MDSGFNPVRYRLWAPIYDRLINRASIRSSRRKEMQMAEFNPGDKVLLVGVGTGVDLPFLPDFVRVVAIDITPEMISRTSGKKRPTLTELVLMDAEFMAFPDGLFDVVIMNLVLSVTDHPQMAMSEALRVMKAGGRMMIFDKFMGADEAHPRLLRAMDRISSVIATSLIVKLEELTEGLPVTVMLNIPSDFLSRFRIIALRKDL